jgi:hypothetical protein
MARDVKYEEGEKLGVNKEKGEKSEKKGYEQLSKSAHEASVKAFHASNMASKYPDEKSHMTASDAHANAYNAHGDAGKKAPNEKHGEHMTMAAFHKDKATDHYFEGRPAGSIQG